MAVYNIELLRRALDTYTTLYIYAVTGSNEERQRFLVETNAEREGWDLPPLKRPAHWWPIFTDWEGRELTSEELQALNDLLTQFFKSKRFD